MPSRSLPRRRLLFAKRHKVRRRSAPRPMGIPFVSLLLLLLLLLSNMVRIEFHLFDLYDGRIGGAAAIIGPPLLVAKLLSLLIGLGEESAVVRPAVARGERRAGDKRRRFPRCFTRRGRLQTRVAAVFSSQSSHVRDTKK